MRVAVIGDVHANLPALEAVLAHARERDTEGIWNVGDFVGYGPFPEEVVQRLRGEFALSTIGNFDRKVLRFKKRRSKWRRSKPLEKFITFQWTYQQLSKKSRKYLRFLSREIRMRVQGRRILLTHNSPGSGKKYLTPDTPQERLREITQQARADVLICGHAHQAFVRRVDEAWCINPGSVGRPGDGDPRASYALLQFDADEIAVQHHRVAYDVEQTAAAIREHNLPEAFARMFLQACDLKTALERKKDG